VEVFSSVSSSEREMILGAQIETMPADEKERSLEFFNLMLGAGGARPLSAAIAE
jgi:hypothetical protein